MDKSLSRILMKNLKKGLRICCASLNRKAKTKGSENMRRVIVDLINRYEFVSGFVSLIYRLFSMNRIRNRKGLRLVCNGAFIKRCLINNYGHNNIVIIGKGCRLNKCKVELYGNNNRIELGQKCIGFNVGLYVSDGSTIKIGNNVHFAGEIKIASLEGKQVCIGDDCLFSSEIRVRNGDSHSIIDQSMKRVNPAADILIGHHVWVGQQVVILKGAMIDRDCVVGIKSLVTGKHFEAGSIIAGSPARAIRGGITWVYDMV